MTTPLKLLIPMTCLLVMNKFVDQEDPTTIFYLEVFFGVGQVILFLVWAIVALAIRGDPALSKKTFSVTQSQLQPPNPLASAMGIKDPNEDSPAETMTFAAYDFRMLRNAVFQQAMQCGVVTFVHYKFGTVMPLVMSVLMSMVNLSSNPLVRLHIFKEDPTKIEDASARAEITRPFKPKNPLGDMMAEAKRKHEEAEAASKSDETAVAEKKKDK